MNFSNSAFVTPLPSQPLTSFAGAPLNHASCPRRPGFVMSADPRLPPSPWDGLRRVIRVSAISASVLMATALPVTRQSQNRLLFFSAPSASAVAQPNTTTNSASDVEAAAMTLGAVTIGGLVMRAIIRSRKDEDEERRRLQAECARLQEQEQERSLRVRRKKMENVEDDDVLPDDQLMSDFMNRVKSLEEDDSGLPDDDKEDPSMRHSPIPDRGMGSAVLDRPNETEESDGNDTEIPENVTEQPPELAKPEEAEMLKRMWNLSSPDKE